MNDTTLIALVIAAVALIGMGLTGPARARVRALRGDESGASGIETAIITAVLAGIAITLTIVIVQRIQGQSTCIASGAQTCAQGGGGGGAPAAP